LTRILYGVAGEGLGHAMRAQVALAHLASRGHRVRVAASGRAAQLLARDSDVVAIDGLSIRYADGAVQRVHTIADNARGAFKALRRNVGVALDEVAAFSPDVVITDFDSFSHAVGRLLDRPVVSFDHQHVLSHFRHPRAVRRRLSYDFPLARHLVERKVRNCDRYIVTSFYPSDAAWCAARTTLVGPVVRAVVRTATPTDGDHVLVYQTASGDPRLEQSLAALRDIRFLVYGLGSRPAAGNVSYRAFDEEGFVRDLTEARAVVTNGGYTTISEALFLGKPVLSVPVRHQGEQELNAAYVQHLGLGLQAPRLSAIALRRLLAFADDPARDRRRIPCGTAHALRAMDAAIEELA